MRTGTSSSASQTSSTHTLTKSPIKHTWCTKAPSNTFPKAIRRVEEYLSLMYNPHRSVSGSSPKGLVAVPTQLPFFISRAPKTSSFSLTRRGCWDALWLELLMTTTFMFSRSLSSLCLFFLSTSLLHSFLRLLINSTNCCGLIDVEELQPRDPCPK